MNNNKIILLLLSILVISCSKITDDINSPDYDIDIYLPLVQERFYADSLLKDNIIISDEQDGQFLQLVLDTFQYQIQLKDLIENIIQADTILIKTVLKNTKLALQIPFNSGLDIDSASFSGGEFVIDLENNTDSKIECTLYFPGLINSKGLALKLDYSIAKGKQHHTAIPLANMTFSKKLQGNNGTQLAFILESNTSSNTGTVDITASVEKSSIHYVKGILPPGEPYKINQSINFDLDKNLIDYNDNIDFISPTLELTTKYISNIMNIFDISLNENKFTCSKDMEILEILNKNNEAVMSNILIKNGHFKKVLNKDNSNIKDIISFLPNEISLTAFAQINPDTLKGEISENDIIQIQGLFTLGSQINVDNLIYTDTTEFKDSDIIIENSENIKSVEIFLEFKNSLAISIKSDFEFLDTNGVGLFSKYIVLEPAEKKDNIFIPKIQTKSIKLNMNEINMLTKTRLIALNFIVNSIGEDGIRIAINDFIDVKSKIHIVMMTNNN